MSPPPLSAPQPVPVALTSAASRASLHNADPCRRAQMGLSVCDEALSNPVPTPGIGNSNVGTWRRHLLEWREVRPHVDTIHPPTCPSAGQRGGLAQAGGGCRSGSTRAFVASLMAARPAAAQAISRYIRQYEAGLPMSSISPPQVQPPPARTRSMTEAVRSVANRPGGASQPRNAPAAASRKQPPGALPIANANAAKVQHRAPRCCQPHLCPPDQMAHSWLPGVCPLRRRIARARGARMMRSCAT